MNLNGLNSAQRDAVLSIDGPILVVAGAGSGKTRVLTHRIAHLIEAYDIFPSSIMAITFTNKAATEMKNRIEQLVGPVTHQMWVGTFHSMCVRILRRDGHHIGYASDFVIYDTTDQKALLKNCFKALGLDEKKTPIQSFQYKISGCKNDMMSADAYETNFHKDPRERDFIKLYKLYQEKLKSNQALDFDDLLIKTIELFKAYPEVLAYYQNKFRYVHVDEYQDTNKAQYTLIRQLSAKHKNLFVVGDGDQSIYKWRGADIRNIQDFEKDYQGAKIIKLEQNYRSSQNILDLANSVIKHNPGRRDKTLWTEADAGEKIRYYQAYDEKDEARFIVNQIRKEVREGNFDQSDFAILYRTNAQSRALEDALNIEGLPYKVVGGLKFYERKEIKDVLAYFKLMVNPFDDVSFRRVINEPKRSIGDKTIEKLQDYATEHGLSLLRACANIDAVQGITGKTALAIRDFYNIVNGLAVRLDAATSGEIFDALIEQSEIIASYERERTDEADGRIDNIYELKTVIEEFEKRQDSPGLRDFLAETTLRSDQDSIEEAEQSILLMTLHASKGLEFPVVFLVGLEQNLFPSFRAMDDETELEEERRLCYVGITRAESLLFITHAKNRNHYGRFEPRMPSVFLSEMNQSLLETMGEKSLGNTLKESPSGTKPLKHNPYFNPVQSSYAAPEKSSSSDAFAPGDKVMHKVFGSGMIIAIDTSSKVLTIVFDAHGIKKLDPSIAPIKKL
ncbi:MAG: ATP-dependent DNA helicase PcrA [Clostridiales bacterium 38-18]|nr:MAG: ATP-dependent DNA helicase PcrA [Clostridiales bacterium 38-18]